MNEIKTVKIKQTVDKLVTKINNFHIVTNLIGELHGEPNDFRNYLRMVKMKALYYIDCVIKIMGQN